jgi:FMN reductase
LSHLADAGVTTGLLDLTEQSAEGLLGRREDAGIERALAELAAARVLVVGTPVFRATYTGLLKVFFDLLPPERLRGTVTLPIATGGGPAHLLMVDYGLRPLVASLGGLTTATAIYATAADFDDAEPGAALAERLRAAVKEALALARALTPA